MTNTEERLINALSGRNVIEADYNGPHVKTTNDDLMVNVWS